MRRTDGSHSGSREKSRKKHIGEEGEGKRKKNNGNQTGKMVGRNSMYVYLPVVLIYIKIDKDDLVTC